MKLIEVYENIQSIMEELSYGGTASIAHNQLTKLKEKAAAAGLIIEVPPIADFDAKEKEYNSSTPYVSS